jgi:hypothetical protein
MKKNFTEVSYWLGLLWLPGYIALQGIPHTGSLRTLFSLVGIIHVVMLARRSLASVAWPRLGVEAWVLAILSGWLVFQSAFLSHTPLASLTELSSEWLKLVLMVILGVWLVAKMGTANGQLDWLPMGLFLGYFIHVIATLTYQVWGYLTLGHLLPGFSFFGNYGYASPPVSVAFAFLLAESVLRLRGQSWLPFSNIWLLVAFAATLLAVAVLGSKAGMLAAFLLLVVATGVTAVSFGSARIVLLLAGIAILLISISIGVSNRWHGAYDAIHAVMSSPIDLEPFSNAAVKQVDESFYVRAAYAKIGFQGMAEYPLGLGYGSDAFGRYALELGGAKGLVSSHSGWLDFTLANGIPGLLLLLLLFGVVIRSGWFAYRANSPVGLALMFVVLNFAVRSSLDGHLFGSRFVGFAFVTAILWALAICPRHRFKQLYPLPPSSAQASSSP